MPFNDWEHAWQQEMLREKYRQRRRHVIGMVLLSSVAGVFLAAVILLVYSIGPNVMP